MTYTENRPTVFECIYINARVGDYFKLPYQPSVVILSRIDLGDYVTFLVRSGKNQPEQWDIMKPEVELAEQERNRIEATEEFELYLANNYDWLTEPIGSNPDAIFGKFVEPSDEEIAGYSVAASGYHDETWTADGCEF